MGQDGRDATARRVTLTAVVLGGIGRLAIVAAKWDTPLKFNDSVYYSEQARQLAHGTFFQDILLNTGPAAEHPPLTSIVLAPVSWGADPIHWQRLVTAVCGIATIWVLARLATHLAGPRAGAVAAVVAAAYPNLWLNDGLVMSESISVLCVSGILLALVLHLDRPTPRTTIALGLLLGLGALARSELALLVVLVVAMLVWRRRDRIGLRQAGLVLALAGVVVGPWLAFNLVRFDRPVTITTNDGTTILGANCTPSWYGPGTGGWSAGCLGDLPPLAKGDDASVRSARQRSLGFAYAGDHLGRAPVVVLARLGRTLDLYGLGNLVGADVNDERSRWGAWAGVVAFWALAPLAAYGVARTRPPARTALLLPCLCVLVATLAFYGAHRIRSSMEPVVVVGAAVALVHLAARRPARAIRSGRGSPRS